MRPTWIIETLRAFANRLWPSARRPTSPSRSTTTGSEEQPDSGHIDDENGIAGSSSSPPEPPSDPAPAKQGSLGSSSDSVDESPDTLTEVDSEDTVATVLPNDGDQEHALTGTAEHSQEDDPEGRFDGSASSKKLPKHERKPRKIGGRRGLQPPKQPHKQPPPSRPELICRRVSASTTWEIILRADEECQLAAVYLDGEPLDHTAHECHVPSLTGRLTVSCQYEQRYEIPLFEDDPLIFKLRKNWFGEGRKIGRITNGYFIVIAPATWERTGRAPVEPDGYADTEFRAHYFYRDATAMDESVDGFREWSDFPAATGIELTGRRVFDDSNEGELFVGDAPSLKSSQDIVWARVGEETEHGWGQNFLPDEQSLAEVLDSREGRFFFRVYDSEVRPLDSTAFRYLRNLKQIRANGADYSQDLVLMPTSKGHSPTEVRFVGADGSTILPILPTEALQAAMPSGALVVPPHPDADRVSCRIETDANGVDIVLDLPRIWWRLEDGRSDLGAWRDMPFIMTRQEFRKHAHSNVVLVLLSRRFGSVCAGFDDEQALPYRRISENDRIAIPLAHFADHAQIDRRLNDDVRFNVEWAGEVVPLIVISADPMPEILSFTVEPATIFAGQEAIVEWAIRDADDARAVIDPDIGVVDSDGTFTVRPADTIRYTLRLGSSGAEDISSTVTVTVERVGGPGERPVAQVMSTGGGWRSGKGFSFRELKDAGLTVMEAMDRFIPIDKRRRTSHRTNVERVGSMLDV